MGLFVSCRGGGEAEAAGLLRELAELWWGSLPAAKVEGVEAEAAGLLRGLTGLLRGCCLSQD